ncbi:hypothetical protein WN51_04666 [Melipona quadrifasciata]|uniref:Uncharacterized protein n=1 Tax=Melipona quadrifasciata TaxID=166423 RepID=A0A0N0BDZ3_9HYME|nr:hypothetical protein WN51_04666 [Melipona quadrifasciata]
MQFTDREEIKSDGGSASDQESRGIKMSNSNSSSSGNSDNASNSGARRDREQRPSRINNFPPGECICGRSNGLVICKACGFQKTGRVHYPCPVHHQFIINHTMDIGLTMYQNIMQKSDEDVEVVEKEKGENLMSKIIGFLRNIFYGFNNPKSNEGQASSLVRSNSQEEEWDYCDEDDCEDK